MKQVVNVLRMEFGFVFLWGAVLVALFETGVLCAGYFTGDGQMEYLMDLAGILLMMISVPFSLKLLSFKRIRAKLTDGNVAKVCYAYRRWSEVRMALLAVTMWTNICFYYLTWNNTGCMCALIAVLGLCFCFPSVSKLQYETGLKVQTTPERMEKQEEK